MVTINVNIKIWRDESHGRGIQFLNIQFDALSPWLKVMKSKQVCNFFFTSNWWNLYFSLQKKLNTKIKDSHRKIDMDFSFQHFPLANFSIWMWNLLLKYIDKLQKNCEFFFPSRKVIEKEFMDKLLGFEEIIYP